ncbi:MAG: S46 family peptidase [Bacteroidales bacterium]|nr:S46 family peptidase [Bacteroidales bacterium]
MRRTIFLIAVFFLSIIAKADDGMWIPLLLKGYTIADMQKKGFKLTAEDIYSINHASLKDAVVIFGGGCTGEIISDKGLLLTNHHCGYSAIHSQSTMEHNYLEDGFWSMSIDDELPIKGLSVRFLDFIKDVTAQVLADVKPKDSESVREDKIQKVIDELTAKYKKDDFTDVAIKPFYYGNQYFMYVYKIYKDIRLVGAPPSSIGKFGGDTDNWMWPRHTGDFSIFRVYAGKDNQPTEYSKDNVPLKPKKSLKISLKGVHPGDFTMVMGFPGRTKEYIPSVAVKSITQVQNPVGIMLRNLRLTEMRQFMGSDPAMKLKYAAQYARVANYWKKWIGENKGLYTVDAIEKKEAFEKKFSGWVGESKTTLAKYNGILPAYKSIYKELNPYLKVKEYLNEGLFAVSLVRFVRNFTELKDFLDKSKSEQKAIQEKLIKVTQGFYKNYDYQLDSKIYFQVITAYNKNVSGDARFSFFAKAKPGSNILPDGIQTYTKSLFTDSTKILNMLKQLDKSSLEAFRNDPLFHFYREMVHYYRKKLKPIAEKYDAELDSLNRIYMAAQMAFEKDRHFYSDANFTMRVAYGQVKGFEPRDGVVYKYNTTLQGIIEKDDSTVYDYKVAEKLKEIYKTKDFGKYGENGKMPVCFIATNHTTGGNSGSPVFDAEGNLIGVNFDRNWEGTMSDIWYDTGLCRNISLDIRYFLLIVDKFGGDKRLIDEMQFVE